MVLEKIDFSSVINAGRYCCIAFDLQTRSHKWSQTIQWLKTWLVTLTQVAFTGWYLSKENNFDKLVIILLKVKSVVSSPKLIWEIFSPTSTALDADIYSLIVQLFWGRVC